jgi:phage terminase large subunit GpA-like protein
MKEGKGLSLATAFYVANREAMDAGSRVGWPERYNSDEVSALQHAMNLMYNDKTAFLSEYQNAPLPMHKGSGAELEVDAVASRLSGIPKAIVPDEATRVVAFADVQQRALYWVVMAFDDQFAGSVIDYGTWPEQPTRHFEASSMKKTLQRKYKGGGLDAQIKHGLSDMCDYLIDKDWLTEAGLPMKIERMLIDANWGASTEAVREYCKRSKHKALLLPTHGRYVGASSMPFSDQKSQKGDRAGLNWRIPAKQSKVAGVRYGLYDTNFWKSFVAERLLCDSESNEAFRLYGNEAQEHRMIAEHMCSEYRVRTQGRGREVDEWKIRPDRTENHWWDCVVGCCVAASMQGASPEGLQGKADRAPQRRTSINLPLAQDPGMGSFGF